MKIVTGATGHVGNVLVRELLKRGEEVTAMLHKRSPDALADLDVPRIEADITDPESLEKAFKGIDTVYHCAAMISIMPGQYKKLKKINVDGTANVIKACRKNGVKKMIYVSSIEAVGDPFPGTPVDESMGFNPEKAMMEYGVTKAEASLLVKKESCNKKGPEIVTVNPVGVIGPYDFKPCQMGTMFIDFVKGRLPAYPAGGGFDFVDVRDVVNSMLLAEEKGIPGEHYLISSEHVTIPELMERLETITGKRKPFFALPLNLLYFFAFFAEYFYKISGKEAVITRDSVNILRSNLKVDGKKAEKELGYSPRPLDETIRDHIKWLQDSGKV